MASMACAFPSPPPLPPRRGEASIRWHSERDHPLAARDRDDTPSLGRDHGLIIELERSPGHIKVRFLFRAREGP